MYMYMHIQDSPHTGWEWLAPTTTQHFLPPLRLVLPPLTEAEMLCLMQFDSTIAKVYPPLRLFWGEPCIHVG